MNVCVLAKDELEAKGIEWMIQSHMPAVSMHAVENEAALKKQIQEVRPAFVVLDMDRESIDELEKWLAVQAIRWVGLSSERMFQTAYRALKGKAEDVLFRPFSPMDLIRHLQQARFRERNHGDRPADSFISWTDLFLSEKRAVQPFYLAAFLTPAENSRTALYSQLCQFPFPAVFALTDFMLAAGEKEDGELQAFMDEYDGPLAIVAETGQPGDSVSDVYRKLRLKTKQLFFEGYGVILTAEAAQPRETDPLLSPVAQREWINMLEKKNNEAVTFWFEQTYQTMSAPYPDPEMVRISLTSVLAQVRRYMKSHGLDQGDSEAAYKTLFHAIVHEPVMYRILQQMQLFIKSLFHQEHRSESQPLAEKVRLLMEMNYHDSTWGLAACAESLRMAKSTLSRRFQQEAGQSFRDVLHQVKLEEAKRLLSKTDCPVAEIAALTGYSHQAQFAAKFKEYERMTPREYRQKRV